MKICSPPVLRSLHFCAFYYAERIRSIIVWTVLSKQLYLLACKLMFLGEVCFGLNHFYVPFPWYHHQGQCCQTTVRCWSHDLGVPRNSLIGKLHQLAASFHFSSFLRVLFLIKTAWGCFIFFADFTSMFRNGTKGI